jgi:DNA-directed RNA polymerase subunit RPC12/RpoP
MGEKMTMVVQRPRGPWYVCLDCHHLFSLPFWKKIFLKTGELPKCQKCGGGRVAIPHF